MATEVKKQNKYKYLRVLQIHTAEGWEDVDEFETSSYYNTNKEQRKEIKKQKDCYHGLGYATQLINRKELN